MLFAIKIWCLIFRTQKIKFPIPNGFNSNDSFRYKEIVPLTSPMLPSHVELSNDVFVFQIEYYLIVWLCVPTIINLFWQLSGVWAEPNYGKLIQPKPIQFCSIPGVWARPIWKTHPTVNFRIFGRDTERFLENSSKYGWIFQKSVQLMPQKLKFRNNTGLVFQKSVFVAPRKTEISENFLDEFSSI